MFSFDSFVVMIRRNQMTRYWQYCIHRICTLSHTCSLSPNSQGFVSAFFSFSQLFKHSFNGVGPSTCSKTVQLSWFQLCFYKHPNNTLATSGVQIWNTCLYDVKKAKCVGPVSNTSFNYVLIITCTLYTEEQPINIPVH